MTSTTSQVPSDYVPVPCSSLDLALIENGYYVGRVERSLYWIADGDYTCAFLATRDGVALIYGNPGFFSHACRPARKSAQQPWPGYYPHRTDETGGAA